MELQPLVRHQNQPNNVLQQIKSEDNIFEWLYYIVEMLNNLSKNGTVQLGLQRVGKTTFFNYIMQKTLIGVQFGGQVCYQTKYQNGYLIQHKSRPVTFIPNTYKINDETFVDLAGLNQKGHQDPLRQIFSAFILKSVIKKFQKCRFILIVTEASLSLDCQDFQNFIKKIIILFAFDKLSEQKRKIFLDSIVLTVTKVPSQYLDEEKFKKRIETKVQDLVLNLTKSPNQFIKQFFDAFLEKKNIFLFQKAKLSQEAPMFDFFTKMQDSWKYCHIKLNQIHVKMSIQKIYQKFQEEDKKKLSDLIAFRLQSYKAFSEVLKKFMIKAKTNILNAQVKYVQEWTQLQNFQNKFKIYSTQIYSTAKKLIPNKFLQDNIIVQLTSHKKSANIIQIIELLPFYPAYLYNQLENQAKFKEYMREAQQHILKLMQLFRDTFCETLKQQNLVLNVMFLIHNGFSQFSALYEIKKQILSSALSTIHDLQSKYFKMPQTFNTIKFYIKTFHDIYQIVQQDYNKQKIQNSNNKELFLSDKMFFFYCNFAVFIFQKYKNQPQIYKLTKTDYQKLFTILKICTYSIYDLQNKQQRQIVSQDKRKITLCLFLSLFLAKYICQWYQELNKQLKADDLKKTNQTIQELLYKIGNCLEILKNDICAFYTYILLEESHLVKETHQRLIQAQKKSKDDKKIIQYLINFGDYSIYHGEIERGRQKYKQAKSKVITDHDLRQQIQLRIQQSLEKQAQLKAKAIQSQKLNKIKIQNDEFRMSFLSIINTIIETFNKTKYNAFIKNVCSLKSAQECMAQILLQ